MDARLDHGAIGNGRLIALVAPRPDDARAAGRLFATQYGVEVLDAGATLHLYSNVSGDWISGKREISIRHLLYFALGSGHRASPPTEAEITALLEETDACDPRFVDDFGATTSAFTICSLWWAEALALAGRLDQAIEVFERVVAHANPLGLFSEDIEPETGRLLGNVPQAYTHVGLIHAAMTIGVLRDARDGRVRAWI